MVIAWLALLVTQIHRVAAAEPAAVSWIEVNQVLLRYQLTGSGIQTVVLLHELSMSLEVWDELMPVIAKGRRVLRYDLRGAGMSERLNGPVTLEDEVEDLRALLAALKINGKVILIGSTAGGAIALKFAAAYPDLVSGVVAISPAAYMRPRPERLGNAASDHPPRTARELRVEDRNEIFPENIRQAHPERLLRYRGIYYASDPVASRETTRMLYAVGFAEVLPQIRCRVLVVATSLFIRPLEELREIASAIPRGQFEVIEAGHLAPLESPELVAPLLLRTFAQLKRER